jgi:hypothetical protein
LTEMQFVLVAGRMYIRRRPTASACSSMLPPA